MSTNLTINASPTKEFFIHMLTRDVPLARAIIDLVDNSVDGARRLRPDGEYAGLWCHLKISPESFTIEDNCGGIPINTARNYAFRFGRPPSAPNTENSVGQFGVGMKRTFFKLGRKINVNSATKNSRFSMVVDVDEWLNAKDEVDDWHFRFSSLEEDIDVPESEVGTKIIVRDLWPEPKQSFGLANFAKVLETSLSQDHALMIEQGLAISLNDIHITQFPLELLQSEDLTPVNIEKHYYETDDNPVKVRIMAGLSSRQKEDGGWYVFCNGRMVLRADQSSVTGWGDSDGKRMPKYHPDFAFFRGYVFFDCRDASRLPWTTTKTGVNADAWLFRAAREEMIEAAKPVLSFLRDLAQERSEFNQGDRESSELEDAISNGLSVTFSATAQNSAFKAPALSPVVGPRYQKVQYSRLAEQVEEVKKHLGVKSFTDVGIRTFEYYREYEMNQDDG